MAKTTITVVSVDAKGLEAVSLPGARSGAEPVSAEPCRVERGPDGSLDAALLKLGLTGSVTIALSGDQVLLRILRLPLADDDDVKGIVALQMARQMPFPGEELSISHEVLRRDKEGLWVMAAASPLRLLNKIDAAAGGAGLNIKRVDASLLGVLCLLKRRERLSDAGRAAVLVCAPDGVDLMVLDEGLPRMMRRLAESPAIESLLPELTRSLMHVEFECGPGALSDLLVVTASPPDQAWIEAVGGAVGATARIVAREDVGSAALGVAERTIQPDNLNLVPDAWRVRAAERRTRRRAVGWVGMAVLVWAIAAGVLVVGPNLAEKEHSRVLGDIERMAPSYNAVRELRDRVRLILRYTDRSQNLLECLREVVVRLPRDGIELTSVNYRREEGIRLTGDALTPELVYTFKEEIDASEMFESSELSGPTLDQRRRRHAFELDVKLGEPTL